MSKVKIALVDDHVLLRTTLADFINKHEHYEVTLEADNGCDFFNKMNDDCKPDLVLMDISMPEMNGYQTTAFLTQHHPSVKVLSLSMLFNEKAIMRIFRCGARGHILKNAEPLEFIMAMKAVMEDGYYYSELVSEKLMDSLRLTGEINEDKPCRSGLNSKELEFLKLICSEMTYKEIASSMYVSPRTIDDYRDALFKKLRVHTRVGLVLYSVKNGIARL